MNMHVDYLPDECVDDALDGALRALFVACFTNPADAAVFGERRYWIEPCRHRWIIRDPGGQVVAHAGVHDRHIETDEQGYAVGGIAEVCVHPTHRGRGFVKAMLSPVHEALAARRVPFALLFGNPKVYASSGYFPVSNLYLVDRDGNRRQRDAMAKVLLDTPGPSGQVRLPEPEF